MEDVDRSWVFMVHGDPGFNGSGTGGVWINGCVRISRGRSMRGGEGSKGNVAWSESGWTVGLDIFFRGGDSSVASGGGWLGFLWGGCIGCLEGLAGLASGLLW